MDDTIYSSVPDDIRDEELSDGALEDMCAIRGILESDPGRFFTARELARKAGISERATQIRVRYAIARLVCLEKCPIVGHNSGFTWTSQPNMIRHYVENNLRRRMKGIARRIKALEEIEAKMEAYDGKATMEG